MTSATGVDLRLEEQRDLVAAVLTRDAAERTPFGLYAFGARHPGAELGRAVEREVFGEFFGNTPELLAAEYGPYEASSIFLCAIDHRRLVPAAVARVIVGDGSSSKTLADLERTWGINRRDAVAATGVDTSVGTVYDIATMAVTAPYRKGILGLAVLRAVTMAATEADAGLAVAVLDVAVLDLVQQRTARPFAPFPGAGVRSYLDSAASLPVWVDHPAYRQRVATDEPAVYDMLYRRDAFEPSLADFAVGSAERLTASVTGRAPALLNA
jgi:hypothetical protein